MKKVLFSSLLVVSLIVTGCTNSNNSQTSNKESFEVEVLNYEEYDKRFNELYLNTASVYQSTNYPFEHPKEVDKYFEKYKDYEGDRLHNLVFLDAYKDFISGLVKFKADDATLNKFHTETIKNAIQTYSILEDSKEMFEKYEKCLEESNEGVSTVDCRNPNEYEDKALILRDYSFCNMERLGEDYRQTKEIMEKLSKDAN